jgi:hypothetical protein
MFALFASSLFRAYRYVMLAKDHAAPEGVFREIRAIL